MGILRYEANLVQAVLFEKTNPTRRAVPDILRSHEVGLRFEAKEKASFAKRSETKPKGMSVGRLKKRTQRPRANPN